MRTAVSLLVFLGLVGAALVWPPAPPRMAKTVTLYGTVTSHGFPVPAGVEVRRVREPDASATPTPLFPPSGVPGPLLRSFEIGPNGSYRVEGLRPGEYRFRIRGPAGHTVERTIRSELPGEVRFWPIEIGSPGGEIRGRAVWSDGRPFRGEVITNVAATTTDADGRFRFAGRPPRDRRIRFVDTLRISRFLDLPEEGDYEVTVDEGLEACEGRVTDAESGEPVGGAFVLGRAVSLGQAPRAALLHIATGAFTDHDGHFRILLPPDGTLEVRARAYLASDRVSPEPGRPADIRLTRCPVLTGTVRNAADGRRVPNVPLLHPGMDTLGSGQFRRRDLPDRRSDARGRFRIECSRAGDVTVAAIGNGWVSKDIEKATEDGYNPVALTVAPAESRDLTLPVIPSPSITGRVVDHRGRPVPWIRVNPVDAGDTEHRIPRQLLWTFAVRPVTTDAEGRFRIPTLVPGGRFSLAVGRSDRLAVLAGPFEPGPVGDLRLGEPWDRRVVFRVFGEETGAPLAGAEITLSTASGAEGKAELFSKRFLAYGRTGADGRLRLGPLPGRALVAKVECPGFARTERIPVTGERQEVRLPRGGVLSGRVELPDGSPAAVCFIATDKAGRMFTTDSSGHFHQDDLPHGEHRIRILHREGGQHYEGAATVRTGQGPVVIRLTSSSARRAPRGDRPPLEVRIVREGGDPVGEGTIEFIARDTFLLPRYRRFDTDEARFTEGRSRFQPDRDHDLVWIDVRPSDPRLGPALAGPFRTDAETGTVRLPPPQRLAGVVTGPDGRGVCGVRVFARPNNDALREAAGDSSHHGAAYTDGEGRFEIRGLGRGRYRISVNGPREMFLRDPVVAISGVQDVRIRLIPAAVPTVTVTDERGRPLAGVQVGIRPTGAASGLWPWHPYQQVATDRNGRARLGGLDPGKSYTVNLFPLRAGQGLEFTQIEDFRPEDRTFRMTTRRVVRGVVRDAATGQAVGGAAVWWVSAHTTGTFRRLTVGDNGTFAIDRAPEKPLLIRAGPRGASVGDEGNVEVRVAEDRDEVEIRIPKDD